MGLTNSEGNHGEDVKELYYYLDGTPTHSYLKMLYKYPQAEFPYDRLVRENGERGISQPELELIDTGVFDDDRYFDVFVEYAQGAPEDILMRVIAFNRGPEPATLHLLPQLWFRNTWSWKPGAAKPKILGVDETEVLAEHEVLGAYRWYVDGGPNLLFTENETNFQCLQGMEIPGHFKDAFHARVVNGDAGAVNPANHGTKAAAWYRLAVAGRRQPGNPAPTAPATRINSVCRLQ